MTTPTNTNPISATPTTTWKIDPNTSRAEFTARMRLMFVAKVSVHGRFTDLQGTLTGDESDPTHAQVNVTIGSASLDTKLPARDKHLRSADFFEVEHYPHLTFTGQRIEALDRAKGHYRVTGTLTIRDVAREVSLDAWYATQQEGAEQPRHTFDLTTALNRQDFGLVWSRSTQKIADDVTIALHIELVPASASL